MTKKTTSTKNTTTKRTATRKTTAKRATSKTPAKRASRKPSKAAEFESQVNAISRSQAVIEFDLEGNVLSANDNFLNALGYTLDEIQGQHHRMFVPESISS